MLIIILLLDTYTATILALCMTQILFNYTGVTFGNIAIKLFEPFILVLIGCFLLDLLLNNNKPVKWKWTSIHTTVLIFLIFFFIAAFNGIYKGYYGSAYRSDFLRGPIYFSMFFLFSYLFQKNNKLVEKTIWIWLFAVITGVAFYSIFHIFRITIVSNIDTIGQFRAGVNIQVFIFAIGFSTILGFLHKKIWWLFTLLLFISTIYTARRTAAIGAIVIIIIVTILYSFTLNKKQRLKILGVFSAFLLTSIFFIKYFLILIFTDISFQLIQKILSRLEVLTKIEYLLYLPSVQIRLLEHLETIYKLKQSSILFGQGLGTKYVTMENKFFMDGIYGLVLGKMGLLGLLSLILMLSTFLIVNIKLFKKLDNIEPVILKAFVINSIAISIITFIIGLTMSWLWLFTGTIIATSLFMAVSANLWWRLKNEGKISADS